MNFKHTITKIKINDVEHSLFYDLNAYSELETRYGSVDKAIQDLSTGSLKALRVILWAGLIHDQTTFDELTGEPIAYGITIGDVGKQVSAQNLKEVAESIGKAIAEGMPGVEEPKNEVTT